MNTTKGDNLLIASFWKLFFAEKFSWLSYLPSSEMVSFLRPRARRAFKTLRPATDSIRLRKPCLFFLFLFDG